MPSKYRYKKMIFNANGICDIHKMRFAFLSIRTGSVHRRGTEWAGMHEVSNIYQSIPFTLYLSSIHSGAVIHFMPITKCALARASLHIVLHITSIICLVHNFKLQANVISLARMHDNENHILYRSILLVE